MSKITPKNLHYDSSLPPFLARLQANNNPNGGRHEFPIARPKKARNADEEAEDEPVYFNEESGETLTRSEWEAREAKDAEEEEGDAEGTESKVVTKSDGKEKVAAIGVTKKRKVGKVVGAEDDDVETIEMKPKKSSSAAGESKAAKAEGKKGEKSKPGKKAKMMKLSFDD
jgi:hypothetical protein